MKIEQQITKEAILQELGQRLAYCRVALDITQADAAEQSGVSKRTIERIEAGNDTQERALAAPRGPDDDHGLAIGNGQVEGVKGEDVACLRLRLIVVIRQGVVGLRANPWGSRTLGSRMPAEEFAHV